MNREAHSMNRNSIHLNTTCRQIIGHKATSTDNSDYCNHRPRIHDSQPWNSFFN